MLTAPQQNFVNDFLNRPKQLAYFFQNLPMAVFSGTRLEILTEEKSVATVPFYWQNKNPFKSMYFAVQSMAAELSTASLAMLAMKKHNAKFAFIITKNEAEYFKKAQTKISFICTDYRAFEDALAQSVTLQTPVSVRAKTEGFDASGNHVSTFFFTWSFKPR